MMVESEAKELSRRGDARRGHVRATRASQKVCEAIINLAEKAAKDPWELACSDDKAAVKDEAQGRSSARTSTPPTS